MLRASAIADSAAPVLQCGGVAPGAGAAGTTGDRLKVVTLRERERLVLALLTVFGCDVDRLRGIEEPPSPAVADPCGGVPRECPGVGPCGGPQEAMCADGLWVCADVIPPGPETCNRVDDDCDGSTDEDLFATCWPAGACTPGISRCGDTICYFATWPSLETCDHADNDCNGIVDDGFSDCCGDASRPEVCDHQDNDCDGAIDEGLVDACGYCPDEVPDEVPCNLLDDDCDGGTDEDDGPPFEVGIAVDTSGSNIDGLAGQKAALQAVVREIGALLQCSRWDVVAFPTNPNGAGGTTYLATDGTAQEAEAAIARMAGGPGFWEPSYDLVIELAPPHDALAVRSIVMVADEGGQTMVGANEYVAESVLAAFGVKALTFTSHEYVADYDALGPSLPLWSDIRAETAAFLRKRAGP